MKTLGGWEAVKIWDVHRGGKKVGFYAIHKPGDPIDESVPQYHDVEGRVAGAVFAINEPPTYGKGHPADIVEWDEEDEE